MTLNESILFRFDRGIAELLCKHVVHQPPQTPTSKTSPRCLRSRRGAAAVQYVRSHEARHTPSGSENDSIRPSSPANSVSEPRAL